MNWRWVSVTALLAAVVIGLGAFLRQADDSGLTTGEQRAQPGYYLKDAIITDTDATGNPALRLAARRIEQRPQDGSIALEQVHVDYLAAGEQQWQLTADSGTVPSGSTTITFSGNVTLESRDEPRGAVIRTDTLSVDTEQSIASTAAPVSIEVSGHRVHARGMRADLNGNQVQLDSEVNGRFVPN